MELNRILKELETLPKGYISTKVIKGKSYFYLQYLENGKIVSKYIKRDELSDIEAKIQRRKELESLLRKEKTSKPFTLSERSRSLTGYIMHEDDIVAKFENGVPQYIDEAKAPLFLKRTKDIASYLESRTLDLTRPNARFLLKQLGIDEKKEEYVALYANGATIQDRYWFKPLGSRKRYKDICFDNDLYSDAALKGKIVQFKGIGSPSPEFTNIGSFEKCWKKIDGKWWLYKSGKEDEIQSEMFVYSLASILSLPIATYEMDEEYIRTLNFADKHDFEPMYSLIGDNERYDDVFSLLFSLGEDIAASYLSLLWFDCLVYNVDRHNQNYGVLRHRESGRIISLAPNFDNNLALLAYNKTLDQSPSKDGLIQMFVKFIRGNEIARNMFASLRLPIIDEDVVDKALLSTPKIREKEKIKSFILNRYEYLNSFKVNL